MNHALAIFIIGFAGVLLVANFILLFRSMKVRAFRIDVLIELADKYNRRHSITTKELSAYRWFVNKHTKWQMELSCKKLTLENWYTPEEIHKINN